MQRAVLLDPAVADSAELAESVGFWSARADGSQTSWTTEEYIRHLIRLGMVEASRDEVADEVAIYLGCAKQSTRPRADGGSSLGDSVDYLEQYSTGGPGVREALTGMKLNLQRQFACRDVGSTTASYVNALDNGNTCVRYEFVGSEPIVVEFEANRDQDLVIPRTESAAVLMKLVRGEAL